MTAAEERAIRLSERARLANLLHENAETIASYTKDAEVGGAAGRADARPGGRRMNAVDSQDSTEQTPTPQGLVLFEVYEKSGALLLVTSDATLIETEPGDRVVRRPWATASGAEEVRRG